MRLVRRRLRYASMRHRQSGALPVSAAGQTDVMKWRGPILPPRINNARLTARVFSPGTSLGSS